jgi:hypothetical protein
MRLKRWVVGFSMMVLALAMAPYSHAIPPFSRMYGTSCSTCHIDFPKLNDFGKAFKDAGFKFPKGDEDFIKIPPVMLGAPAQKEMFPKVIYPGTIPGIPQIGLRFNTFFQVYGGNRNNFAPPTPTAPGIPRTDFQPGLFSIFTAGNFGSDIAFWVDDDFSVGGANSNGGLGDGYLKFVNIGRLFKLPTDALSLRVGQFEIDLPFSQARTWNLSGWDIYDQANFGAANGLGPGVNNAFAFSAPGQGVEISGGHNYGGYHYSLAVLNQNTSGTTAAGADVSPEVGIFSDSNFKDLYGRFQYRFNLEKDAASRNDIQAAGATGPRDHTYLQLGTYYFYGRSVQRATPPDTTTVFTAREPFYRTGGDFSFNYRTFNLFGLYMYGHDRSQVLNEGATALIAAPSAHFSGGLLEADYLALPWLMTILRYDRVQSTADFLNGAGSANYFSPASATRNRVTPGVQFLIHANIKASFEYQIRPQQAGTDTNGNTVAPQRTNQAVAGLEWVY